MTPDDVLLAMCELQLKGRLLISRVDVECRSASDCEICVMVIMGDGWRFGVALTEWIIWSDGEFVAMPHSEFCDQYQDAEDSEAPPARAPLPITGPDQCVACSGSGVCQCCNGDGERT